MQRETILNKTPLKAFTPRAVLLGRRIKAFTSDQCIIPVIQFLAVRGFK